MNKLQDKLAAGIVIFDGAMGTEIYRRNFFVNTSYEHLSLTQPEVIKDIHLSYLNAGAEVLTTNTFNANARRLGRFGLADQTAIINQTAVLLAKEVAGSKALIAASVGPIGEADSPDDTRTKCELLCEQIASLQKADFIIFESIRVLPDLNAAIEAMQQFSELPYVVSMALDSHGDQLETFMERINNLKSVLPVAIGLNCGSGPEQTMADLEKLVALTSLPIIVQPNAGVPRGVDGRMLYMTSAEYFSTYARRYAQLGAGAIGGCCGITPEHIADLSRTVKPITNAEKYHIRIKDGSAENFSAPIPLSERSPLGAALSQGRFVRSIEITPPAGFDLSKTLEGAKLCRDAGIDVVNLPDGPRASARIAPLITALTIEREVGIATVPHCCCRDRSLIGLQAELLSYAGANIHNILCITGDPPKLGDYPFSTGVFDIDSIGLVSIQANMNKGVDIGGKRLSSPTSVAIGVGADPSAIELEREIRRVGEKVAAGADFLMTQPVFVPEKLFEFLDRIAQWNLPVIAGVWPLTSFRNAQFMRDEVPGVVVPDWIMKRMASSSDREEQRAAGIAIAKEIMAKIRDRVQGVQVNAPFGNVKIALKIFDE